MVWIFLHHHISHTSILHLVKRSLTNSTSGSGSERARELEATLSSSLTISVRQETIARSLPDAKLPVADVASAVSTHAEAGRHQITVLSPIMKLRWSSRARLSEEAVDKRMTRKLLCGTGNGRLRCGSRKPLEDRNVMRRWMACSWFQLLLRMPGNSSFDHHILNARLR